MHSELRGSVSRVEGIRARPPVGALFIQPPERKISSLIFIKKKCMNFKTKDRGFRDVYVFPFMVVKEWFLMSLAIG